MTIPKPTLTFNALKKHGRVFFSVVPLMLLVACSKNEASPEVRIRQTIEQVELSAEQRSLPGFMAHISPKYSDHQDNDRDKIAAYVQLHFMRNQDINIFSHVQSIKVDNLSATAEISVAVGRRTDDLNQENVRLKANTMHFSVLFKKNCNHWQVTSVSWRRGL